jgi:hypothetical protein
MRCQVGGPGEKMADIEDYVVGKFYWVMPMFDVDGDEEWECEMQPARFAGRNAEGQPLWNCLAIDGVSDWPMRWVGGEVDAPSVMC